MSELNETKTDNTQAIINMQQTIAEQQKLIDELMAENEMLLELHEAARVLLRYSGVDTDRANKAYDYLAAITYKVNDIKQTDTDFLAEHDARVVDEGIRKFIKAYEMQKIETLKGGSIKGVASFYSEYVNILGKQGGE